MPETKTRVQLMTGCYNLVCDAELFSRHPLRKTWKLDSRFRLPELSYQVRVIRFAHLPSSASPNIVEESG